MRDVWVLGCSPSLSEVEIPKDVFTIGVNDSYLHHWSPIHVTVDKVALQRDYGPARAIAYITAIDPNRVGMVPDGQPLISIHRPERPMLRLSGPFAYWVALNVFNAERVHLVGFDMERRPGHFEGAAERKKANWAPIYGRQRERLRSFYEDTRTPTYIWVDDHFASFEGMLGK